MGKFTKAEMKKRSCLRVALVLFGHYEEGTGAHSRLFETLIPDEYVTIGESKAGRGYREHVVPCSLLRNICLQMYKNNQTVEEVAAFIETHLYIVRITFEEAHQLDKVLGLKNSMPEGWRFGVDDVFARLKAANIEFKLFETEKAA